MSLRIASGVFAASLGMAAHAVNVSEPPDLSNDWTAPTVIALDPGSNWVKGTSGYSGSVLDRDFFRIDVPVGHQLSSLVLGLGTEVGGAFSFIGVQAGNGLTIDPNTVSNGSALLGWHLYGSADKGTNILPAIGGGADKIGFSGALPSGSYTFWVQELAPSFPGEAFPPYPYELNFNVTAVPEPGAWVLLLGGLAAVGRRVALRSILSAA
ncbi:MAG: hypothetical protein EKK52_03260 [Burkholderiales bacterium]|uniref:PEP-CTERM sorting domain-containing protein n=1 Tax=Roseateles sp. TaxID=1971397 RepID=UPI000FB65AA9|nr:MAG: hypothetical protein EKK52_03260 [Burkholderiales bacterium]